MYFTVDSVNEQQEGPTLAECKEAFEEIMKASEENDIDVIVGRFIKVEADNFALFNYVGGLEIESATLKQEVSGYRKSSREHLFGEWS